MYHSLPTYRYLPTLPYGTVGLRKTTHAIKKGDAPNPPPQEEVGKEVTKSLGYLSIADTV